MNIPNLTEQQLVERLLSYFPRPWTSAAAEQPGGNLYSLLMAIGGQPDAFLLQGTLYAAALTRISTATGDGLDLVAHDYFGDTFPRLPGESDASYRARIKAQLLRPRVTRPAIQAILDYFSGLHNRLIEPFNANDTCAWDVQSYWDMDDEAFAFLWGDPGNSHHKGYIQAPLPLFSDTGGQPVYGWDAGFSWDVAQSYWYTPGVHQNLSQIKTLCNLILAYKAEGTMIGVKIVPPDIEVVLGIIGTTVGEFYAQNNSYDLLRNIKGARAAIITEPPQWSTTIWMDDDELQFKLEFGVPSPFTTQIVWMAMSLAVVPQTGKPYALHMEIPYGVIHADLPADVDHYVPIILPSWNATAWVVEVDTGKYVIEFSTESAGHYDVIFFPIGNNAGVFSVDEGSNSTFVPHTMRFPYAFFAIPNWNTAIGLTKQTDGAILSFSVPAPANAKIYWAAQELS